MGSERGQEEFPSWIGKGDGLMNIVSVSGSEERLRRCGRGDLLALLQSVVHHGRSR